MEKSTANAEAWIDATTTTKPSLIYLLKASLQELKKQQTLTAQFSELRNEICSSRNSNTVTEEIATQVQHALSGIRAEMVQTVQREVKDVLSNSGLADQVAAVRSYASATSDSRPKGISHAIKEVRVERHAQQLLNQDDAERKKRELNLRIRGLPGSETEDDKSLFGKLLEDIGVNAEVQDTNRIETKSTGATTRSSHLIVTLENARGRLAILKATHKLKYIASGAYSEVFIGPDFTPMQDRDLYELREERRRRNALEPESSKKWVVHRGVLKQICDMPTKSASL